MKPFATHRDLIYERWLRGRLSYKLHEGQKLIEKQVEESKHQLFVGVIARQFGKSFWLVKKALETAFQKPKAKIKFGTAFQTDLVEFILPTFDAVMEDCPEDLRPVWKSQKSKFVLPHNGSEIKLVGLDRNPNSMRGNVLDLLIIDECGFVSRLDYLYKSIIVPATTHRPNCRILFFSTPPHTPTHEFKDYAHKAEVEGGYLKLTIYDNPRVTPQTIERLIEESGGEKSTTWRREYLSEFVTDAELSIFSDWKTEYENEMAQDQHYELYQRYVGMDLGVSDQTAVIFGYYDFLKAKLVLEEDFVMSGSLMNTNVLQAHIKHIEMRRWNKNYTFQLGENGMTEQSIDFINQAFKNNPPRVTLRVSDNNNPLLLQDLSYLHGLHFVPTDKGRLAEMVNTVKILIRNQGLVVHPRCTQTLGCLRYGVWDKNRESFAHSNVYGHYDAAAALIYLVRNLDQSYNPIPADFRLDRDNQILFNHAKVSETVRTLKDAFGL